MEGSPREKHDVRCGRCRKFIRDPDDDRVIRIAEGRWGYQGYEEEGIFARMHRRCFRLDFRSPDLTMEAMRELAAADEDEGDD